MYSKALDVDNLAEFPQVTWSHFLPEALQNVLNIHENQHKNEALH